MLQSVDENTKIALGAAISVVSTAVLTTWWLSRQLSKMRGSISNLGHRLALFKKDMRIRELKRGRAVTRDEVSALMRTLAARNPGIKAPRLADQAVEDIDDEEDENEETDEDEA